MLEKKRRTREIRMRVTAVAVLLCFLFTVVVSIAATRQADCEAKPVAAMGTAGVQGDFQNYVLIATEGMGAPAAAVPELTEKEKYLLEKIAMAETEGEPTETKALVILTVLNRVKSEKFPDSVKEVIYQPVQFTPIANGRFDRVVPDDDCRAALELVLSGWDESEGALYFGATPRNRPTWHSRNLRKLFSRGPVTFYTEWEDD